MAFFILPFFTKILILLFCARENEAEYHDHTIVPVVPLNFTQMAAEAGLPCEEVEVITEDGYILTMFHIPGDPKCPAIMLSGNFGTSDEYLTRGRTSLPYVMWKAGFDTWVGNVRGCRYGRRHVSLDPDNDDEFWSFSIHEFGVYDTPAMIDYILKRTGAPSVASIGWSCGTTVNYIMGAERPEYIDKVNVIISLAPICYLHHSKPFNSVLPFAPIANDTFAVIDANELFGERSNELAAFRFLCCASEVTAYEYCLKKVFSPVVGYDLEQMEPKFTPNFFCHWPSSSSLQNEMHLEQILKTKTFAKFDYGPGDNKIRYGCSKPKEYDLSKNTIPVVLISGKNDQASTLPDVDLLKTKLPNIVEHIILKPEKFNHLDFVCGRDTHKILYEPIILEILQKYCSGDHCEKKYSDNCCT